MTSFRAMNNIYRLCAIGAVSYYTILTHNHMGMGPASCAIIG